MKQLKNETLNHYTNLIKEMSKLNMSKDQQIEYLKSCLLSCEYKMRKKIIIERLLFLSFIFIMFGFYLISIKLYLLGILFVLILSIYISYKMIMLAEEKKDDTKENERKKLISLLNSKIE